MTALQVLYEAEAAGIQVTPSGDNLRVVAQQKPPQAVLDALARHKPEIVEMLKPDPDGWSAREWQTFFDERVVALRRVRKLTQLAARQYAYRECITKWLNRNPQPSQPGTCIHCGQTDVEGRSVVPVLTLPAPTWLHSDCWPQWHGQRKQAAREALARYQILESTNQSTEGE